MTKKEIQEQIDTAHEHLLVAIKQGWVAETARYRVLIKELYAELKGIKTFYLIKRGKFYFKGSKGVGGFISNLVFDGTPYGTYKRAKEDFDDIMDADPDTKTKIVTVEVREIGGTK